MWRARSNDFMCKYCQDLVGLDSGLCHVRYGSYTHIRGGLWGNQLGLGAPSSGRSKDYPFPQAPRWLVSGREGARAHFGSCMCLAPPVQVHRYDGVKTGAHRPNPAGINSPLFSIGKNPGRCVAYCGGPPENLCGASATVPRILSEVACNTGPTGQRRCHDRS